MFLRIVQKPQGELSRSLPSRWSHSLPLLITSVISSPWFPTRQYKVHSSSCTLISTGLPSLCPPLESEDASSRRNQHNDESLSLSWFMMISTRMIYGHANVFNSVVRKGSPFISSVFVEPKFHLERWWCGSCPADGDSACYLNLLCLVLSTFAGFAKRPLTLTHKRAWALDATSPDVPTCKGKDFFKNLMKLETRFFCFIIDKNHRWRLVTLSPFWTTAGTHW